MQVKLHPEARTEFRSAALWYEERRPGLGDEFVEAIELVLGRIDETPKSFPSWTGTWMGSPEIRKATVEHFPYVIAFEHHDQFSLVLAVAHQKRRPLYWLTRAGQELS